MSTVRTHWAIQHEISQAHAGFHGNILKESEENEGRCHLRPTYTRTRIPVVTFINLLHRNYGEKHGRFQVPGLAKFPPFDAIPFGTTGNRLAHLPT